MSVKLLYSLTSYYTVSLYNNFTDTLYIEREYCKVRTQQKQKQAWDIQEVKDIKGVTENNTNTEAGKIPSRRKGESLRDAFRPRSRISSGGRTSWETNRRSRREKKT